MTECKRCGSENLEESIQEIYLEDWMHQVEIAGTKCLDCGCFHYELDNNLIYEFYSRVEEKDMGETVGKYVIDYDKAKV